MKLFKLFKITAWAYLILICISNILFVLYNIGMTIITAEPQANILHELWMMEMGGFIIHYISSLGTGVVCFWKHCHSPLLAIIIEFLFIFVLISIIHEAKKLPSKKVAIRLTTIVVLISLLPLFMDRIINIVYEIKSEKDWNYYKKNYYFDDPLQDENKYIYPKGYDIFVSDIYGKEKSKLYTVSVDDRFAIIELDGPDGREKVGYVSPAGNYFMSCEMGFQAHCSNVYKNQSDFRINLCLYGNNKKEDYSCPTYCDWSPDESSFTCKYKQKEFESLVVFSSKNGTHKEIKMPLENNLKRNIGVVKNFSYLDSDSLIYSTGNKLIQTDIIDSHNQLSFIENSLDNLLNCPDPICMREKIVCSIDANKQNIKIKDKNNLFIDHSYYFISQNLKQNNSNAYTIINKAPIEEPSVFYLIGDRYIGSGFRSTYFTDIETGRVRERNGRYDWEERINEDGNLIFNEYLDSVYSLATMPRVYQGK